MSRRLQMVIVFVAALIALTTYATYQRWRYSCVSREAGLRGEVKREANGRLLYFNGECWTRQPQPPTDSPF